MSPRPWKRIRSNHLLKDNWLSLRADVCLLPNGTILEPYYVLEERDWVHVVAMDEVGQILIVRQFRYAANAICVELPGGVIDDGEDALAAAKRELREETGYEAAQWRKIAAIFANPARQTNRAHVFVARELVSAGQQALDHAEEISFCFATIEAIKALIRENAFSQALHIASLYLALEAVQTGLDKGGIEDEA